MVKFIVTGIASFLFLYFSLYFHESGHAFFAIIFTKDEVRVRLGGSFDRKIFKIGRLIICLNGFNPWYGTVHWNNESLSKIKRVFISLGGPIFSLLLSLVLWLLIKSNSFIYINKGGLQFMFIISIWQFISTIITIKYSKFWGDYEGMNSDGLSALLYFLFLMIFMLSFLLL